MGTRPSRCLTPCLWVHAHPEHLMHQNPPARRLAEATGLLRSLNTMCLWVQVVQRVSAI